MDWATLSRSVMSCALAQFTACAADGRPWRREDCRQKKFVKVMKALKENQSNKVMELFHSSS